MKRDSGAVEFNAVLLLFFIVALISGGVLYAAAAMNYAQTDTRDLDLRLAADQLLDSIITEMQMLRLYPYDDENNAIITELCQKYKNYNLEFTDVSSGYHLDFLSDADLADGNITGYLFRDNSGAGFVSWRNANGLSVSKTKWREYVKDEAWDSCVSYGWLHKDDTESFAFRSISISFAATDPNKLFPLLNEFPRMNVNMVRPEILHPLITRSSFKIEKPKEKADALTARLRSGPVLHADISSILEIPVNHKLMGYLGTKTAFWKINFVMRTSMTVEAVVAAIPKKNGAIQEIEAYRLIDRSFSDD
jgi:hypothetical protein